jgi:hypothetical protein
VTTQQLQPLSVNELTAQNRNFSVILARVDCRVLEEGQHSLKPRAARLQNVGDFLWLVLGDVGSAGLPKWTESKRDFHFLSEQTLADGWIALVKPPGYYYLYLVGMTSVSVSFSQSTTPLPRGRYIHRGLSNEAWSDPLNGIANSRTAPPELVASVENAAEPRKPTLRIEVPAGDPVIYAGSFHVDCPTKYRRASL